MNGGIAGLHVACKLKVVYGVFMATVDFLKKKPTQGYVKFQPDLAPHTACALEGTTRPHRMNTNKGC